VSQSRRFGAHEWVDIVNGCIDEDRDEMLIYAPRRQGTVTMDPLVKPIYISSIDDSCDEKGGWRRQGGW
jgi:hypothetical protein